MALYDDNVDFTRVNKWRNALRIINKPLKREEHKFRKTLTVIICERSHNFKARSQNVHRFLPALFCVSRQVRVQQGGTEAEQMNRFGRSVNTAKHQRSDVIATLCLLDFIITYIFGEFKDPPILIAHAPSALWRTGTD